MEPNPERPSHLHASSLQADRPPARSRAAWRRHLEAEPHGVLRKLHHRHRPITRTELPAFATN